MNNYILNCKSAVVSRRTTPRARLERRRVASQCAWRHATERPVLSFLPPPPNKAKESRRLGQIVNLRRQVMLVHLVPQSSTAPERREEQMKP